MTDFEHDGLRRRASDWSPTPQSEREAVLLMAQSVGRIEKMFDQFLGRVTELEKKVDAHESAFSKLWGSVNVLRAVVLPIALSLIGAAIVAGFNLKP